MPLLQSAGTPRANGWGMKIRYRTFPVSQRVRGWRRLARCVKHALRGTLVIQFGHTTASEFAG